MKGGEKKEKTYYSPSTWACQRSRRERRQPSESLDSSADLMGRLFEKPFSQRLGISNLLPERALEVSRRRKMKKKKRRKKLTCSTLFIKSLFPQQFRLNQHIPARIRIRIRHIRHILLCTAIIPRISAKRLPNTHDRSIGGHVDAVRGKNVLARADIQQVRLGMTGGEIGEDEGGATGE